MKTISFLSTERQVGKTTCLINCAHQLANTGARVGLLDFNLAAPQLARLFRYQTSSNTARAYDDVTHPMVRNRGRMFLLHPASAVRGGSMSFEHLASDIQKGREALSLDYMLFDTSMQNDEGAMLAALLADTAVAMTGTAGCQHDLLSIARMGGNVIQVRTALFPSPALHEDQPAPGDFTLPYTTALADAEGPRVHAASACACPLAHSYQSIASHLQ